MVNELFVEVVFFMDRDSLDSMQLACRFMLHYIREREANELALRRIWNVHLGKMWRYAVVAVCKIFGDFSVGRPNPDDEGYWLPRAEIDFKCVHGLLPYLRLAYCGSVYVLLETIQSIQSYEIACGMLFDDLNVRETHVESLDVYSHQGSVDLLNRTWIG